MILVHGASRVPIPGRYVLLVVVAHTVAIGGCATATRAQDISSLPATELLAPEGVSSPGRIRDEDTVSPSLLRFRRQLETRLINAHRRFGRGRPAATVPALGELGPGGAIAFTTRLSEGRCYTIIVVGVAEDQEIDVFLSTSAGVELSRDLSPGSQAHVDMCPTSDGEYRVLVRMYGGVGPFALQVFGS